MKIIKAGYEIMDELNGAEIIKKIERCGRVCYKSEERITAHSAAQFVESIIKNGHESVLEHVSFSVRFIVDRGVSHEIVRHRIASYSQESTRYCNYGNDDEITFIDPLFWDKSSLEYSKWKYSCQQSEFTYLSLIKGDYIGTLPIKSEMFNEWVESVQSYDDLVKATPQEARSILPNSLKTEIIMTTNLREWRHFFKLRTASAAHPQMREVTIPLLKELKTLIPIVFDDII